MTEHRGENGRIRVNPAVLVQIVAWLVSILLAYGALNARISVLETKYDQQARDISEIKADVKQLLKRP